jgi:RimJ/RimL family protein N-acetyltransferase
MKIETIPTQSSIEATRFTLRPLQKSDVGLIEFYAGDKRVAEMTSSIPHPLPPGAIEAFIDRSLGAERVEDIWALDGTKSGAGELLGVISLKHLDARQSAVGYWIGPPFWNAGYASEAVKTLVAANPLGNQSIVASVFQDNFASARVVTNAGFKLIGESESFSVARKALVDKWDYVLRLPVSRVEM